MNYTRYILLSLLTISFTVGVFLVTPVQTVEGTADTAPPGTITDLRSTHQGTNSIVWRWTNPTDRDFDRALVFINGAQVGAVMNNFYNAGRLQENTRYTIQVKTRDMAGNVNETNVSHAETTLEGFADEFDRFEDDTKPSSIIRNLHVTSRGAHFLTWRWTNPTDPRVYGVVVRLDGVRVATTFNNHYTADGLKPNTRYTIRLRTVTIQGDESTRSVASTQRTRTSDDAGPPEPVRDLQVAERGTTFIKWTWTNPPDDDFSEALVFLDGFHETSTQNTEYMATRLSPGTFHTLRVQTRDTKGNVNHADISSRVVTLGTREPTPTPTPTPTLPPAPTEDVTPPATRTIVPSSPVQPVVDTTPPDTVANLQLKEKYLSFLAWQWENPSDADFAEAIVYLNGVEVHRTTDETYSAENLDPDTTYTLEVETRDTHDNVNTTRIANAQSTLSLALARPDTEVAEQPDEPEEEKQGFFAGLLAQVRGGLTLWLILFVILIVVIVVVLRRRSA